MKRRRERPTPGVGRREPHVSAAPEVAEEDARDLHAAI